MIEATLAKWEDRSIRLAKAGGFAALVSITALLATMHDQLPRYLGNDMVLVGMVAALSACLAFLWFVAGALWALAALLAAPAGRARVLAPILLGGPAGLLCGRVLWATYQVFH